MCHSGSDQVNRISDFSPNLRRWSFGLGFSDEMLSGVFRLKTNTRPVGRFSVSEIFYSRLLIKEFKYE